MGSYKIAVLPGDGVGPEVVAESVKVLLALEKPFPKLRLLMSDHAVGAKCYQDTGTDLPDETLEACKTMDAVLFGSAGDPNSWMPFGASLVLS